MNKIGFLNSESNYEKRIALIPKDLETLSTNQLIYIEQGYGTHLGYTDEMYEKYGVNIVPRSVILDCDVICDAKIGDSEYVYELKDKILFGYFHAVQNKKLADSLTKNNNICIAWEDMFCNNEHIFAYNNVLAGYAAVQHAMLASGQLLNNRKIAIIGNGNTAQGAKKALMNLNNEIDVYGKKDEHMFMKNKHNYSVFINAVLWDITRNDYLISKADLKKLKSDSFIIDISCDIDGAIESSHPVNISNPIYEVEGILHYSVSNTPSIYAKNASCFFSSKIKRYIEPLCNNKYEEYQEINNAIIISSGNILDRKIIEFQQ